MVFKTFKNIVCTLRTSKRITGFGRIALESAFLLGMIAALESLGSFSTVDFHDLAIVVGLIPAVLAMFYFHHKRGSRIIAFLDRVIKSVSIRFRTLIKMEVGADFRSRKTDGVTERRPYRDLKFLLITALLITAIVLPLHRSFPGVLQGIRDHLLYTPYLLTLVALWAALAGAIVVNVIIIAILFYHYVMKSPFDNPRSRHQSGGWTDRFHANRLVITAALVCLLCAVEILFGKTGWFWVMAVTATVTFFLTFIPRANETVELLIKKPRFDKIQSISISEWNFSFYTILQALGLVIFVIATGAGWFTSSSAGAEDMPCTYALGRTFGMLTALATLLYLSATVDFLDLKRIKADPALPRTKTLLYRAGSLPDGFTVAGWELKPTTSIPRKDDADLYFDPDPKRRKASSIPVFNKNPLSIPPKDREFYLDRADFIHKRRTFYRGLNKLLKICHAASFRDGSGYIMIPHCYFVEGLHRDDRNEDLEEDRVIGPRFQELWGLRVRHFLHSVLEAMDIDIVYFEDGIKIKQLKAVFEVLFEMYHARGPNFRVEEYHFMGLNGVRVVLEMMRPDQDRNRMEGYPETHFSNLSQARILVIFKDRGGGWSLSPENTPGIGVDIPAFF